LNADGFDAESVADFKVDDGGADFGAGAGRLDFISFIRGLVVALVPLVRSLSAFAAASFGFAFAHWSIAEPAGFDGRVLAGVGVEDAGFAGAPAVDLAAADGAGAGAGFAAGCFAARSFRRELRAAFASL
jgi:hypothetical protein